MAENSVSIDLNEKKRKLTEIIESDSNRLNTKRGKWDSTIITDMEQDIEEKKEILQNINCLLSSEELSNSKSRQKLKCKNEKQLEYLKKIK